MDKGFVIISQDWLGNAYQNCAEVLASSIKRTMPDAKVSIISDNKITNKSLYDKVIPLPYGDQAPNSKWKLINDWQVYEASPYEYTIKLEADMYLPRSIDHWWDVLKQRDLVISTTIRDFKQDVSKSRVYRRFLDENKLPNTYNAITYFKKSETAQKFFELVRHIFENWDDFRAILKCSPYEEATTDWVYAIAAHIIGVEKCIMPNFQEMSMVHMKRFINNLPTEDWTDVLIYELLPHTLRINSCPQHYPFHYHIKSFANKISKSYGNK
jgi:hypothetical protein